MFGHTEAIIDCSIIGVCVKASRGTDVFGWHPGDDSDFFWRIFWLAYEILPFCECLAVTPFAHKVMVDQIFGDHDVREGVHDRYVGPGL